MTSFAHRLIIVSFGALVAGAQPGIALGQIQTSVNEHFVQSSAEPDARIYVRERLPAGADPGTIEDVVLFVHGATYAGDTFDLEIEGYDWMAQVAERGLGAYYVDVRGYGRSTRPAAMSEPPEKNEPFSRAKDAVVDIGDAVEFILGRTGAEEVNLIGWSWGTVTAGMYAAENGDKVDRLVLYGPVYSDENPEFTKRLADPDNPDQLKPLGAYRAVNAEQARERWEPQIVPEDKDAWREEAVFQAWFDALLASEPEGAEAVRAPNGVMVDLWEIRHARPIYDAGAIEVPTLVIRGDADQNSTREDAFGLFQELGSEEKLYVVIGNATHYASLERRAPLLIEHVQAFIED